ncbi:unnamed protein product [Mycena citricolor]|uniref:BHLH domain-containing protein n=1 Tax=Mycena citricolor TaxID=2018698 RepID=A0AAD2GYQ0_9AGAR|nr:unnamed protein product [Mycena citricolor]
MALSPPPPFPDFDFSYDSASFPNAPPLPPSADLFSTAETTDIFGFLDNFGDFGVSWDLEQTLPQPQYRPQPYSNPHLPDVVPDASPTTSGRPQRPTRASSLRKQPKRTPASASSDFPSRQESETPSNTSESSRSLPTPPPPSHEHLPSHSAAAASPSSARNTKPLLSMPQKRLNHIMSEQKRRNAIRDGYSQLITLLAPSDGGPMLGMPQRGRPKGSGNRNKGKGQSKGKSGVLFRAVEYVKWLEEGRQALHAEVLRVEAAAGL